MSILDDVKSVAKIVQQIGNIDLYRQMLDLQSEIMEVVEENRTLKTRIAELERAAQLSQELIVRDDCYWLPGGADKAEDGPFCTNCWDVRRHLVRMWQNSTATEFSTCPTCSKPIRVRRPR